MMGPSRHIPNHRDLHGRHLRNFGRRKEATLLLSGQNRYDTQKLVGKQDADLKQKMYSRLLYWCSYLELDECITPCLATSHTPDKPCVSYPDVLSYVFQQQKQESMLWRWKEEGCRMHTRCVANQLNNTNYGILHTSSLANLCYCRHSFDLPHIIDR